ncbi:MAG: MFS transporter [Gemmatimonadaceae bacterium]
MRLGWRPSNFGLFWAAQAVSHFGDPITVIALATVTYRRTNSALFTSLAVVIATVPSAIFSFFAGVIADAIGHRRLMIISDVARVVLVASIPVALDKDAPLAVVYAIAFAAATCTAAFNPARAAIVPQLVEPTRLASSNAVIASTDRTIEILGALAAGLLVATIGEGAFYVDAATFAASAGLLSQVSVLEAARSRGRRVRGMFAAVREGLRFLSNSPVLRANTMFSLVAQLAIPVGNGLTPVYLVRRFAHGDVDFGAALFGVAEAAIAAGAVSAGFMLPDYTRRFRKGQLLLAGFGGYGLLMIFLGAVESLLPAMILFFLMGIANVVFVVPNITISQAATPPQLRARVFGARIALLNLSWLPMIVLGGLLADRIDVGLLISLAGALTLATVLFAARFVPAVSDVP